MRKALLQVVRFYQRQRRKAETQKRRAPRVRLRARRAYLMWGFLREMPASRRLCEEQRRRRRGGGAPQRWASRRPRAARCWGTKRVAEQSVGAHERRKQQQPQRDDSRARPARPPSVRPSALQRFQFSRPASPQQAATARPRWAPSRRRCSPTPTNATATFSTRSCRMIRSPRRGTTNGPSTRPTSFRSPPDAEAPSR